MLIEKLVINICEKLIFEVRVSSPESSLATYMTGNAKDSLNSTSAPRCEKDLFGESKKARISILLGVPVFERIR